MTGTQIKDVLEEALVYTTEESGSPGAYPYAAGLRFDVDYNNGAGNRISGLEVNSRLEADWSLVIPAKTYTVVSNSFIAEGRDGYLVFGNIATELKKNTYLEYANSFVKFAKAKGGAPRTHVSNNHPTLVLRARYQTAQLSSHEAIARGGSPGRPRPQPVLDQEHPGLRAAISRSWSPLGHQRLMRRFGSHILTCTPA